MRRIFLTLLMVACACIGRESHAQKSAVQTAWNRYQHGEYEKARESIDQAIRHPQTQSDPTAWFYRGKIYYALLRETGNLALGDTAIASYRKVRELDPKNRFQAELQSDLNVFFQYLWSEIEQKYQANDWNGILALVPLTGTVGTTLREIVNVQRVQAQLDTFLGNLYEVGADAAFRLGKYEQVVEFAQKTQRPYYRSEFGRLAEMDALLMLGRLEEARESARQALEDFPNSQEIIQRVINVYLELGENEKTLQLLDRLIQDPLPDTLRAIYMHIKAQILLGDSAYLDRQEEAVQLLEEAFRFRPHDHMIAYDLGTYYYNRGVDIQYQMNQLDVTEVAKIQQLQAQRDEEYRKALPYLEKAYELAPPEEKPQITPYLRIIYQSLGMTDKLEQLSE